MRFIPFLLLLVLILSMWLLPSATPAFGISLVVISFGIALFAILKKHSAAYRLGRIRQSTLFRRIFLDVFGILLAVALAALLGRYVAGLVARPISNDLWRLIATILIGLLVGMGVGILVSQLRGRLIKISSMR